MEMEQLMIQRERERLEMEQDLYERRQQDLMRAEEQMLIEREREALKNEQRMLEKEMASRKLREDMEAQRMKVQLAKK